MNLNKLHAHAFLTFEAVRVPLDAIFNKAIQSDKATNITTLVQQFNSAMKQWRIKVKYTEQETTLPSKEGHFYPYMIGICDDPAHPESLARIIITLNVHPKVRRLSLISEAWGNFQYRFYQTILHELVHRAQFKHGYRRNSTLTFRHSDDADTRHSKLTETKALRKEQRYLGEIDEVEAYARDLVEDFYYFWPDSPLSIRKLKKLFKEQDDRLYTIRYYSAAYNGDLKHPAVVRLFRKVKQWNKLITPLAGSLMSCPTYVRYALKGITPE